MKNYRNLLSATLLAATACGSLHAASIVSGSLALDFDQATFGFLGLTNINSFDQSASNARTAGQIQADAGTSTSWSGVGYGINSTTPITDPIGRNLQETNFTYNPANLTGTAAGAIGIGGTTRWDLDPLLGGGSFILGDYTLSYDAARVGGVYSGWVLTNYFTFPAVAFDLANVTTHVLGNGFDLSGDLYVKPGSPLNVSFGLPGDTDYGNFSLSASTVPEPSAAVMGAFAAVGLLTRRRRKA